jgi:hypothetical protein
MKLDKCHREISDELARYGITPDIEPTGHSRLRFHWTAGGHLQSLIVSKNVGDPRGQKNNIATVRRLMREAGVDVTSESSPRLEQRITDMERGIRTLIDMQTRLQTDVQALLDHMTNPAPAPALAPVAVVEPTAPVPVVEAAPAPVPVAKPKPMGRKRNDLSWLWREMKYDDYMTVAQIAKATRHLDRYISVLLTGLKKQGLVQHIRGTGWRKAAQLERALNNGLFKNGHAELRQ